MGAEKIILDDSLKDIYFKTIQKRVIAIKENGGVILYTENHSDIRDVREYICNTESLYDGKYYGQTLNTRKVTQVELEGWFAELSNEKETETQQDEYEISRKLKGLLQAAATAGTSDIHVEIYTNQTLIYFRVDGHRVVYQDIPDSTLGIRITSHIFMTKSKDKEGDFKKTKVNNGNIDESLVVKGKERSTRWRCAWLPSAEGGKLCIRWLDSAEKIPTLEDLNWEPEHIRLAESFLVSNSGLFLMAGQTGSGKTTTLAALIEKIDKVNSVHSLEDPPEFKLNGVVQTHTQAHVKVDEGSDEYLDQSYYAKALLRHDSDFELHGETREKNGALQVFRKGETGQKVFTTVHTSSAIGIPVTFIEQFFLTPSLVSSPGLVRFLVYQTLVRKLCPHCSLSLEEIQREPKKLEHGDVKHIEYCFDELTESGKLSNDKVHNIRFKNIDGCEQCDGGEKGRLPLVEMIVVDDDDREYFKSCDFLSWKKHLYNKGYKDVKDHALLRLARGEIDLFTTEERIGTLVTKQSASIYEGILDGK